MSNNSHVNITNKEYVNIGLERWKKTRESWLTPRNNNRSTKNNNNNNISNNNNNSNNNSNNSSSSNNNNYSRGEVIAKNIDIEDVIDHIFNQSSSGQFTESVPLGQMIDILIDFWESDGLYD